MNESGRAAVRPRKFWHWFFRELSGARAGWTRLVDRWLILHVLVGFACAYLVPASLAEASRAVLLPLAGVLAGMSFAWIGSALAFLQSSEIEELAERLPGGLETYAYAFQTATLLLLMTLVGWGLAGLGVFDGPCFWNCGRTWYKVPSVFLYASASISVRECWGVITGSQSLLLYQIAVRRLRKRQEL